MSASCGEISLPKKPSDIPYHKFLEILKMKDFKIEKLHVECDKYRRKIRKKK